MNAYCRSVTPHRLVLSPAVSDFLVVQWFKGELPPHRQCWFSALPDDEQVRLARYFHDRPEGK